MLGLHWMASAAFHFWRFSSIHFVATEQLFSPPLLLWSFGLDLWRLSFYYFPIPTFQGALLPFHHHWQPNIKLTKGEPIPGNKTASAGQDQQEFGWSMSIPPRIISIPSNPFPLKLDIRFRRYSLHILILMNASFRCKSWFIVKFANSNGNRSANQINIFLNW